MTKEQTYQLMLKQVTNNSSWKLYSKKIKLNYVDKLFYAITNLREDVIEDKV